MEEAFKITAIDVGKDWTKLYQHLPFVPARDPLQRTRDLEGCSYNIVLNNNTVSVEYTQVSPPLTRV